MCAPSMVTPNTASLEKLYNQKSQLQPLIWDQFSLHAVRMALDGTCVQALAKALQALSATQAVSSDKATQRSGLYKRNQSLPPGTSWRRRHCSTTLYRPLTTSGWIGCRQSSYMSKRAANSTGFLTEAHPNRQETSSWLHKRSYSKQGLETPTSKMSLGSLRGQKLGSKWDPFPPLSRKLAGTANPTSKLPPKTMTANE